MQDHWLPGFNFNVEEWDAKGRVAPASCCHNNVLQQRYSGGRSCDKIQLPECSFAG
jgi:hypothetical protein